MSQVMPSAPADQPCVQLTPAAAGAEFDAETVIAALGAFRAAWDASPAGVVILIGPEHTLIYQNAASQLMMGARTIGVPVMQAFPDTSAVHLAELNAVLASGQAETRDRDRLGVVGLRGGLHVRYVMSPLRSPAGQTYGVVVTSVDLSAEAVAEVATLRARMLTALAEQVSGAGSPTAGLAALTEVLVPEIADLAAVYVLPEADGWRPFAAARSTAGEPVARTLASSLAPLGPPPPRPSQQLGSSWPELSSGQVVLVAFGEGEGKILWDDEPTRSWLTAAGAHNIALVPLVSAGSLIGILVLLAAGDRLPFAAEDLPFLADVAARAGTAVGQVRANWRKAELARDLQKALLPFAPPSLSGWAIAARYVAGERDIEVGGDWWDVVRLPNGHIALGAGDVCGRGIDAAVVMGYARAAMRAASLAGLGPAEVLHLLDIQLRDLRTEESARRFVGPPFATATHADLDLTTGDLLLANAAHLPLMVHVPGAGSTPVRLPPSPPLSFGLGGYQQTEYHLAPGATLLMYTDGLLDGSVPLDQALGRLAGALDTAAHLDVEELLDSILSQRIQGEQPGAGDDIVLLVLRRDAGPGASS
jgi:hypothetical protein